MMDLTRIEEAFMTLITSGDADVANQARFIVSHQAIEMHDELLVMRAIAKELAESDPIVSVGGNEFDLFVCVFCDAGCDDHGDVTENNEFFEKVVDDHRPNCLWLRAKALTSE